MKASPLFHLFHKWLDIKANQRKSLLSFFKSIWEREDSPSPPTQLIVLLMLPSTEVPVLSLWFHNLGGCEHQHTPSSGSHQGFHWQQFKVFCSWDFQFLSTVIALGIKPYCCVHQNRKKTYFPSPEHICITTPLLAASPLLCELHWPCAVQLIFTNSLHLFFL